MQCHTHPQATKLSSTGVPSTPIAVVVLDVELLALLRWPLLTDPFRSYLVPDGKEVTQQQSRQAGSDTFDLGSGYVGIPVDF